MAHTDSLRYEQSQRRPLSVRVRVLHWLFVIGATVAAFTIALPSVLSQPTLYTAAQRITIDPARYPDMINTQSAGVAARLCAAFRACAPAAPYRASAQLLTLQDNLGGVLQQTSHPSLRQYGLAYVYPDPATIQIVATARTPEIASSIAQDAADGLARRVEAVRGAEVLRALLSQEMATALNASAVSGRDHDLLRGLIRTQAIACLGPANGVLQIETLPVSDQQAVTRALEVLRGQIFYYQKVFDNGRGVPSADTTCLPTAGFANKLRATDELLRYMYATYGTNVPQPQSPVASVGQMPGATAIPSYRLLKLVIAALVGLLGGFVTVALDRRVGIVVKLGELWDYRQLIRNMVARDLKARYKGSVLGYVWSLLNPLMMMLVFWVVFSVLLRNGIPMFPVFLIVALLPWNFTVTSVSGGMRSIIDSANLIKKVYFPREILPITVVLSNLINFLLALPVMLAVMALVQWTTLGALNFSWVFVFFPVILAIHVIFLIGLTLLLSTVAVFFRDTTHIIEIFIQLWMFLTPVFFSLNAIVSSQFARLVRWLNPMASIIDFYRDILYGQADSVLPTPGLPALDGVFRTLLTALVVLAIGAYVFHRNSGRFGEEV